MESLHIDTRDKSGGFMLRQFQNSIKRCLNSESGFSLTELLAVLIIMGLAGMVVTAGIPAANSAYIKTLDASNSQILLSTTIERLRDELSVADPDTVKIESDTSTSVFSDVRFISRKTNYWTWILNNGTRGICKTEGYSTNPTISLDVPYATAESGISGAQFAASSSGIPEAKTIVPSALQKGARNNLFAKIVNMSFNSSNRVFSIKIQIMTADSPDTSHAITSPVEFTVSAFNG